MVKTGTWSSLGAVIAVALGVAACADSSSRRRPAEDPLEQAARADLGRLAGALEGIDREADPLPRLAAAVRAECGPACACLDRIASQRPAERDDASPRDAAAAPAAPAPPCPMIAEADGGGPGDGARWRAVALIGRYLAAQGRGVEATRRAPLDAALATIPIMLPPRGAGAVALPRAHDLARAPGTRRYVAVSAAGALTIGELTVARVSLDGVALEVGASERAVEGLEALAAAFPPPIEVEEVEPDNADARLLPLDESRGGKKYPDAPSDPMERLAPRARTPTFARAASGAPVVELPGSPWWAAGQTIPRRVPAGGEAREAFLDVPVLVLADRAVDSATLGAVLSAIPGATVAVDQDGTVAALPLVFGTRGAARSDVPPVHVRVELVSGGVVVDDGSGASPRAVSDADSAGAGWVDALHAGAERAMPRRWPRDVARVQVEVHAGVPAALLVAALEAIAARGRWVLELQAHVPPTGLPTVAIGEATVVGARSKAEVALSVAALAPGLLGCYEATLAVTSGYEGDATLGFFIAPLGDVRATELRLAPPALAECLGGVVAERSYPATPQEGGGTLVQLPVSFRIDRPGVATAGSPRR